MTTNVDALVVAYLDRLNHAARDLPPDRRSELLESIGEHISAARAAGAAADEAAVRTLLDRLGEPDDGGERGGGRATVADDAGGTVGSMAGSMSSTSTDCELLTQPAPRDMLGERVGLARASLKFLPPDAKPGHRRAPW